MARDAPPMMPPVVGQLQSLAALQLMEIGSGIISMMLYLVSTGNATGSKSSIKSKVNSGSMPPGGMPSAADKALVVKWVNDGALCTPAPGCP